MSRLTIPNRDDVPEASRALLSAVHDQIGTVPGFYRLVASSPATLRGYTAFSSALDEVIDLKTRERIAIAIAQENGCDYCLSAHSYCAINLAKIGPAEIESSRHCRSRDAKAAAAMRFAVEVSRSHGGVSDQDLHDVRAADFSDAQIVEIIACVSINLFTNSLNRVARTDIDFPIVRSAQGA
jgi:uncharacterized peroxidase-related enzyme